MIPGIVASQAVTSSSASPIGDVLLDFIGGTYTVAGITYALGDLLSRPELVGVGGLLIPDVDSSPGINEILGAFLDRLLAGSFSVIIEASNLSSAHNGLSAILNVQGDTIDVNAFNLATVWSGGTNLYAAANDYDLSANDAVDDSGDVELSTGTHKIGVIRNGFALPISLAVDGGTKGWINDSDPPATPWTKACLGGDYNYGPALNGCKIRTLHVLPVMTQAEMEAATA